MQQNSVNIFACSLLFLSTCCLFLTPCRVFCLNLHRTSFLYLALPSSAVYLFYISPNFSGCNSVFSCCTFSFRFSKFAFNGPTAVLIYFQLVDMLNRMIAKKTINENSIDFLFRSILKILKSP